MRPLISIAILSLALVSAAPSFAAEKCVDKDGHTIKCPPASSSDSSSVNVSAARRRPATELPTIRPNPDSSIPPMATAQCMDGTFSRNQQPGASCALHGGVAQWVH